MAPLPHLNFNTEEIPAHERFGAWQAALPFYETSLPPGTSPATFKASVTAWFLGDLVVTQSSLSAVRFQRSAERVRADAIDTYNLLVLTHGTWFGRAGGRNMMVGTGQLASFDLSQAFESEATPSVSLAVTIARTPLDRLLQVAPDLHGHVFSGGAGELLTDYLLALSRHLPAMNQDEAPAIARATLEQVAAALKSIPQGASRARSDAVLYKARRFIELHLTDPKLSPDHIADGTGVARSTLYRSFAPLGGVTAYVQKRRLEAVRVLLVNPDERRSISELAQTFGFASASHFSQTFGAAYGITPRALRGTRLGFGGRDAASQDPVERFRAWNSRLSQR
jgi:AraC-like DNA-binding protein